MREWEENDKMKALIFAILILFASPIIGQKDSGDLVRKALQFYIMDQNYDSALVYFQHPSLDSRHGNYLWRWFIGDCHFKLGEIEEAKEVLLQCLNDSLELPIRPPQRKCCHVLADLYLADSQPDSAHYYLKLAEEKWPHVRIQHDGEWERKMALAYQFAKCYRGLGQLDSAISYLTPYAFKDPSLELLLFSQDSFPRMVDCYIEMLFERYGPKVVKTKLQQGIDSMIYQEGVQIGIRGDLLEYQFYHEVCYFEWLGDTVTLFSSYSPIRPNREKPQRRYSKELGVKELKQTLIYRKVMGN